MLFAFVLPMDSSTHGVVAFIKAPLLKSVDQPALIQFNVEYSAYKAKVANVNAEREGDKEIPFATIKDCIEPSVLNALCILGEVEGAKSAENASAESVQKWFEQASKTHPKERSERVDAAFRSLIHKPNKKDPAGGISNFIIEAITALDRNKCAEILDDPDLAKSFLNRLVEKIQPDVLRERIRMLRRGWNKSQLASISLFKKEVSNLAIDISLTELAQSRVKPKKNRISSESKSEISVIKRGKGESAKKSPKRKSTVWDDPCLNPECEEKHPLKQCNYTSKSKKKELYKQYYDGKKKQKSENDAKKVKRIATKSCQKPLPNATEGRFNLTIEEKI